MLGCCICYFQGVHPNNWAYGVYFSYRNADLRILDGYREANLNLGYQGTSLFTQLSTFSEPQTFIFKELRTIARGVCSQLYQMLTINLSNDTRVYYTLPDGSYKIENYPFVI